MKAKCSGGPYDGLELEAESVKKWGTLMQTGRSGQVILLPSLADWERIKTGEITATAAIATACHAYVRHSKDDGTVELRYKNGGKPIE
jgi:hypothetical protein